jgi:PAS domain S-box-containing protein
MEILCMSDKISPAGMTYLKAIFDQSADGLMICDHKGVILKLNKAAEKLNAVKACDLVGKDVISLVKEGRIDRSATKEVMDSGRQVSVIQKSPNSEYTLLVTGTPVFDENDKISFIVINERDISLIESMKKELLQARQESESIRNELVQLSMLELKDNNIVAQSSSMKHTLGLALKLAVIKASNILIQGESGTGKGLLAKFIHQHYSKKKKPFIQINCAALPENLLEAELFGYEKGAFTGASEQGKTGLFELAEGGTLFLDEIAEMSTKVQAKLLKYLDDHEIMPIGGITPKTIKCSIIAATNRNLETRTRNKQFRLDLFHRLNTFNLTIPPLKERPEDILELVQIYLKKYNRKYRRKSRIGYNGFDALQAHEFPGNVRELSNITKQAVVMSDKILLDDYIINLLGRKNQSPPVGQQNSKDYSLQEKLSIVERQMLEKAALECKTTRQAASFLGISQPSVVRKFKKYSIVIAKT